MSFPELSRAIRIFFSYATKSSKDKSLFNRLKGHLSGLMRGGYIEDLCDNGSAGKKISEQSSETSINQADICVLLVSSEFLRSDDCHKEMMQALEWIKAKKEEEACLIPVLLHPTVLKGTPLDGCEFLPSDNKAVSQRPSKDIESALVEVARKIGEAAEELARSKGISLRSESPIPRDDIPYRRNPFFADREPILTTLHSYFISSQTSSQTPVQALTGPAGMGKTQIAIEYAYRHKQEYETILWLKAASRDLLNKEILSRADVFSASEQDLADEQHRFSAVKRWLQRRDKWLLILDDYFEDFNLIEQFIPLQKSSGHVLLTTLSQTTGEVHAVPVEQMTARDCAGFLLRRTKIIEEQASPDTASAEDLKEAESIAQAVDRWSLALDHAGAYIEKTRCGLARYRKRYDRLGMKLLAEPVPPAHAHPEPLMKALSLNFEGVAREHLKALELLRVFAFLSPDAIPVEMIELGAPALDAPLRALAADPEALERAIATLLKFSLVQRCINTGELSIHRIVQAIIKEDLTERQRPYAIQAVRLVNHVFPEPEFSNWSTCEKYFFQAGHCAELIAEFRFLQKEAAHLLLHLGSYCYQRGYYQEADEYLPDALRLCERRMKQEPLGTALALNNLALLYHKRGKYQEAEAHYQRALEIRERIAGSECPEVAQTLNNLALLYKDWGRYQQAEELYLRVRAIDEHTIGLDHPDAAASFYNLALVYEEQGKYSQAEPLYQRALSIEERTLGANHPDLASSLDTLAGRYEDRGDYQQAEVYYRRALSLREQAVGAEHPDTAQSLNNLAGLYEVQEKYEEAEELYKRALSIYEKALGPEHPETARVLNNLGYLSRQRERYQEAEELYKRALNIFEQAPGSEHRETALVLNNLACLLRYRGCYQEAEELYKRALNIYEQALGPEHPETVEALLNLEKLYHLLGKNEQREL